MPNSGLDKFYKLRGTGDTSGGSGTQTFDWAAIASLQEEVDPSKLSYKLVPGGVQLYNTNNYTRKRSIKTPGKVGDAMRKAYKLKYGTDLDINSGSLNLEIFMHALFFDLKILPSKTNSAECGDNKITPDNNRFIWDAWNYNIENSVRSLPNFYSY